MSKSNRLLMRSHAKATIKSSSKAGPLRQRFSVRTSTPATLFLWICAHSRRFQQLSLNLKRAIVPYLLPTPELLCVSPSQICAIAPVANSYRELLGKDQRLDWGNIVVEIGESRLFLYEGIGGSEEGQRTAYLISMQKMLKLPLMPVVKGLAGVIFYASTNSIYLFGGLTRTKESIMLRDAIKLDCSVKKWSPVPPMPSCRFNFLPTPHGSLILLCGGNEEGSVDLYDPRTNQYQTLAVKVPRNTIFTVKSGEEYWSYSEIEVAVWRDGSVLEYRSLQREQGWSPNPGQSIVQIRGKVYVLSAGVRGYYEVCQERVSVMKVPAKALGSFPIA